MHVKVQFARVARHIWTAGRTSGGAFTLRLMGALVIALSVALTAHSNPPKEAAAAAPALVTHAPHTPFYLEKNVGQAPARVAFLAHTGGGLLYLLRDGGVVSPGTKNVARMTPEDGATAPRWAGMQRMTGVVNYLIGNDSAHWFTNVPTYRQVTYHDIYPGIDLSFQGKAGQLEYDWIVRPGGDVNRIRLQFSGSGSPSLDSGGALHFMASLELETQPTIYQWRNGARHLVPGGYQLFGRHSVRFRVGAYDRSATLIIDPVIQFAEYLSGFDDDKPAHVQLDGKGNIYIAGKTNSSDFPTQNAFQGSWAGKQDMLVMKLNPNGDLAYSTFIGGSEDDAANGIAVDHLGQAAVVGYTESPNFPVVPKATYPGGQAAVILSLNAQGNSLRYSLLLSNGGNTALDENAQAVALDAKGNAYIALVLPVKPNVPQEMSIVEIDRAGPQGPATKAGGLGIDWNGNPTGIAVLRNGNVVVVGSTDFAGFPTFGATQSAYGGGTDGFVTEVNRTLKRAVFSTYLGGSTLDSINAVAVDNANTIYVTGTTASANFPQHTTLGQAGGIDPFVTKFAGTGQVLYNTVVGASQLTGGTAIAVNTKGYATIGGETTGNALSMVHPLSGQGSFRGGAYDGFVTTLGGAGKQILFSSYLGGSGDDLITGLAIGGSGNLFVTGYTNSSNFPKTRGDAFNTSKKYDGFLVKIGGL